MNTAGKPYSAYEMPTQLHADHVASKRYMAEVGDVIGQLYDRWKTELDWSQVAVPESVDVPTPPGPNRSVEDDKQWLASVNDKYGSQTAMIMRHGLEYVANAAMTAPVQPSKLMLGDSVNLHKASTSILTGQNLLFEGKPMPLNMIGEITFTNIGVGNVDSYRSFHTAASRALRVTAAMRPMFDVLRQAEPDSAAHTMRGLTMAKFDLSDNLQVRYNPLLHTALEGMTTVTQVVNALIQPGIEGAQTDDVIEQGKQLLDNGVPALLSRVVTLGDIGGMQMAGMAESGIAVQTSMGAALRPGLVQILKTRRDGLRESNVAGFNSNTKPVLEPSYHAVRRYEGCPAYEAVRVMSGMLRDALDSVG